MPMLGQLSFFIRYLKHGYFFQSWVNECLPYYSSNDAPEIINVLLGRMTMSKFASDDLARGGLEKV